MRIEYKGRKSNWNDKWLKTLTEDEFKELCLGTSTFKKMPLKERNLKIKEAYGNLQSNAKKSRKSGKEISGGDLHHSDGKQFGGDTGTEQGSDDGRKDIKGKEDKAKIQKQKLSEKNLK